MYAVVMEAYVNGISTRFAFGPPCPQALTTTARRATVSFGEPQTPLGQRYRGVSGMPRPLVCLTTVAYVGWWC